MDHTFAYRPPIAPSPHDQLVGQDRPGSSSARPTSSSGYNNQQQQQQSYRPSSSHQPSVSFAPESYRPTSSGGPTFQSYGGPSGPSANAQQEQQWSHTHTPTSISPVNPSQGPSSIYPTGPQTSHGYGSGFVPTAANPGANLRNTRPMTAPSSLAPPYFHSTYSPHQHAPLYQPQPESYAPQPAPVAQPGTFQYQVDSQAAELGDGHGRDRGFSLPELVGVGGPGAVFDENDERRYSATSGDDDPRRRYSATSAEGDNSPESSTFFYAPPPATRPAASQTYVSNDDLRRPHTGNSASGSGPIRHLQQTQHFDPYGRPIPSHYSDEHDNSYSPDSGRPGSSHQGDSKVYNFVSQAGHSSKRPRRRFDEIERLYTCDYPGCAKAYGTLNHLNSHKTMQKHGPRATPAQFKELRKAWRDNKKQQAAAIARGDAPPPSLIPAACEIKAMGGRGRSSSGPSSSSTPDRVRPSTSAGEYHSAVPAFMTSLGQPVGTVPAYHSLALPPPPGAEFAATELGLDQHSTSPNLHLPPPPPGMQHGYPAPHVGWNTSFGPAAQGFDDPTAYSPHRPVTAPSLCGGAPTFGYSVPSGGHGLGQADLARPATAESPFGYALPQAYSQGAIHAPQPRRLSLPMVQPQAGGMDKMGGGFGRGLEPFGGTIQEEVGVVGGEDA